MVFLRKYESICTQRRLQKIGEIKKELSGSLTRLPYLLVILIFASSWLSENTGGLEKYDHKKLCDNGT